MIVPTIFFFLMFVDFKRLLFTNIVYICYLLKKAVLIYHNRSLEIHCIGYALSYSAFLSYKKRVSIFHLPPAVLRDVSEVTIWKTNRYIQSLIRLSL